MSAPRWPWLTRARRRRKPNPPLGQVAHDAFTNGHVSDIAILDGATYITFTEEGLETWHAAELRKHEWQVRAKVAQEIGELDRDGFGSDYDRGLDAAEATARGERP